MSPKVSVLTPIYNVSQFLPECLDSLLSQTLQDIEFICINDGSTDNSLEILNAYAEKDDRIVVIDKPNGGYGQSMNTGLSKARGEYIGIVESDDFIDSNAFGLLYGIAKLNDSPDIVKANHYRYDERNGDVFFENYPEEMCGMVLTPLEEPGVRVVQSTPAIWAAIYRREFLEENEIGFLETPGASFQDTGFVLKSWLASERFVLCYPAFLHYRVDNSGSSVKDQSKVYFVNGEFESIESYLYGLSDRKDYLLPHVIAKKVDTYEWNLRRIDDSFKHGFLQRYISEMAEAEKEGLLEKSLYPKKRWERLKRMVDDPDSVLIENQLNTHKPNRTKVSVIVPVYNAMPFLKRTLASIRRQTLREIQVIVVNDGSDDGSAELIAEICSQDKRFEFYDQANQGVCAARNLALSQVKGEYVAFCDADDVLPRAAYEAMYRVAKLENADLVIGREEEFTLTHNEAYARSASLARRQHINKYDVDLNWNLSLCNKLFRAAIIEKEHLHFGDDLITEDGIYLCKYLKFVDKISGCPRSVYKYRRHHSFEPFSATQRIDKDAIASFFSSMSQVGALRQACADSEIAKLDSSEDLELERIKALATLVAEDVKYRTVSFAIERYYRWVWRIEPDAFEYLTQELRELKRSIYAEHWEDICSYNADLELESGFLNRDEFAARPIISVLVAPQGNRADYVRLLESVLFQRFPSYELLVPESCKAWTPTSIAQLPNVRFLSADSRSSFINLGIKESSGSYINILEDRIYHVSNSLRAMWGEIVGSRADCCCVNLVGVNEDFKKRKLPAIELLYSEEFSDSPNVKSQYLAVDSSPNNKLYKKEALMKMLPLSGKPVSDAKALFAGLSFTKLPNVSMACFEPNRFFLDRVSEPVKTSYRLFHRWRKKRPYEPKESGGITKSRKLKKRILFCSNREDGRLSTSMQMVHDALPDVTKVVFCEPLPHSRDYIEELKRAIVCSAVIVTDDYIHELTDITLCEEQSVIQLWHACGAFKMFGLDNVLCDIRKELAKHKQYDAVMVSDESVRGVYAKAFGVDKKVVKAYGVPRTDKLLDNGFLKATQDSIYDRFPYLKGKQVVLYCPTFREKSGHQSRWDPGINWESLDASLEDNQLFIVKKHPLELTEICPNRGLKHILSDIDAGTDELMTVASLLITDCSSIVFDYSLLDKPMVFYFPDYDSFDREFYIDFPNGFGASVVKSTDELETAIQQALNNPSDYLVPSIRKGMMGACDGHSTERIAKYVRRKLESAS